MSSLSASHVATEVHVVRTATVRVVMTAKVAAAMTEAQEVHAAKRQQTLQQSRTTSRRCSNHLLA